MIELSSACKIAKTYLETQNLFLRNTCRDLSDSWVFYWGWKNAPDEIDTSGWFIRISKDAGHISDFVLGVPNEESFKKFMKAKTIDISEYI